VKKSESGAFNKFVAELDNNLKELRDVAQVLGQDCHEQYLAIQSNDNQMYRRAYVRSVFAFIEGILHRMKRTAFHLGNTLGTLLIAEMILIDGASFDIDDKGEVVARPFFIKFLNNLKFSFRVYSKIAGSSFKLDLGGNGWRKLQEAVKVRDRLMHPKVTTDLDVTDAEVEATKKAFDWFFVSYVLCSNYARKANRIKLPHKPEEIAALDMKIQDLETTLKNIEGAKVKESLTKVKLKTASRMLVTGGNLPIPTLLNPPKGRQRRYPLMPNPYPPDDILGFLKLAGSTAGLAAPVFLLIKSWLDARAKRRIKLKKGDVEIELQGGISKKELERTFSQFRKLTRNIKAEEIKVIENGKVATRTSKRRYLVKESDVEAAKEIRNDRPSKSAIKKKAHRE
jgi:hypothetical protein